MKSSDFISHPKNKLAAQQRGCEFERRKTFAVEMDALARSSDIQRSFLRGAADGTRTRTVFLPVNFKSTMSTDSITAAYKTVNYRQERTQERTELLIREMKTEKRLILLGT